MPVGVEPSETKGSVAVTSITGRSRTSEVGTALGVQVACQRGRRAREVRVQNVVGLLDAVRASNIGGKVCRSDCVGNDGPNIADTQGTKDRLNVGQSLRDAVCIRARIRSVKGQQLQMRSYSVKQTILRAVG
jgi:hypothetical protein